MRAEAQRHEAETWEGVIRERESHVELYEPFSEDRIAVEGHVEVAKRKKAFALELERAYLNIAKGEPPFPAITRVKAEEHVEEKFEFLPKRYEPGDLVTVLDGRRYMLAERVGSARVGSWRVMNQDGLLPIPCVAPEHHMSPVPKCTVRQPKGWACWRGEHADGPCAPIKFTLERCPNCLQATSDCTKTACGGRKA